MDFQQPPPAYDHTNEDWYQEYRRLASCAETNRTETVPKSEFFGKIKLDAAVDFVEAVVSRPTVLNHFYYLSLWNEAYLKRPESEHYLPAEADDFPRESLLIKSVFCDWFRLKHRSRHNRHSNYFDLSSVLKEIYDEVGTEMTRRQIAERLRGLDFIEG
ncbi:MAG: hypothetical protein AAGA00_09220 [Pseudomonadota bacterium]